MADPAVAEILATVKQKAGRIPNLYARMVNVPGLLDTYLHGQKALQAGSGCSPAELQTVLLTISRLNGCTYCVAAHSALDLLTGCKPDALRASGADSHAHAPPRIEARTLSSRSKSPAQLCSTGVEDLLEVMAESRERTLALVSGLEADVLETVYSPLL